MPVAVEPISAAETVAFILGVVALIFAVLRARDSEAGMGWFAGGMALLAVYAAAASLHEQTGVYLRVTVWSGVVTAGLACLATGLVDYLPLPPAARRRLLIVTLLPTVVYGLLALSIAITGAQVPRGPAQLPVALAFGTMGLLSAWAAWRERDAGHALLAATLIAMPVLGAFIALRGAHGVSLRAFAFVPLLVMAMALLTSSLLRRRRALMAEVERRAAAEAGLALLNTALEARVAERRADLQNLVAGLESFNRSVSHDLRGSLGGIDGLARLAGESLMAGDDALARRSLPLIADQADEAARLMAALLSLAKVGDAELKREVVDLRELVQKVIAQLTLERGDKPMPRIELAPDMPSVHADPELLKPVLANLIGNAVKFTPEPGAGTIHVGARRESKGVTVHVRDEGVGFDAEAAQRLFAPFVRLHAGRFDGHGVGLSIVRRAVERHGGRVWAESEPGRGSVFRFTLPA